jgi:PTH1 family peptidyl-tRNA hydrolase
MRLFRKDSDGEDDRWIVFGLGNPGDYYTDTRHNVGAGVVELLAERSGLRLKSHRSGCLVAEETVAGERVVLARSTGYMNESGGPARRLLGFYKAPLERLIVVHDELDVPFGEVRVKQGGGTAGHNGLRSIAAHFGKDFLRVRIGIGRPRSEDATGHVLSKFSAAERKEVPFLIAAGADAVERIVEAGPDRAMTETNRRAE